MNRQLPPRFLYPKEWQHLTMFILLTLNGCVDVMSRNLLPQRCVLLEKGSLVLTFYVLLLLLVSHVQDTTGKTLKGPQKVWTCPNFALLSSLDRSVVQWEPSLVMCTQDCF